MILGADTRATEGEIVCDKNCEKIHYLAPNISCCGAGTAADTENVTGTHLPLYSIHLPSGGIAIRLLQVLHSSSFSIPTLLHSSSFSSQVCLRFAVPSLLCSELLVSEVVIVVTLRTDMVSSQLELHRYATGRESRVVTALTMLKSHLFGYILFCHCSPIPHFFFSGREVNTVVVSKIPCFSVVGFYNRQCMKCLDVLML